MKASLPHTLRERKRSRDAAHDGRGVSAPAVQDVTDPAVERVRSAGGPIDEACYACDCGMQFVAAVSTTVVCPHCRAPQAW